MLSKKEIRNWLLKHCTDEFGNLDLSGLDFSEFNGNVIIAEMKVKKNLYQSWQNVGGSLFQGHQKVGRYLFQGGQIVGRHLTQNYQKVKGDIFQNNQSAYRVLQDKNCNSILDKEEKEYLEAVLRPFKDRVDTVIKRLDGESCFICFDGPYIKRACLPCFSKAKKMYQGMEPDTDYTLEELGLFKNN